MSSGSLKKSSTKVSVFPFVFRFRRDSVCTAWINEYLQEGKEFKGRMSVSTAVAEILVNAAVLAKLKDETIRRYMRNHQSSVLPDHFLELRRKHSLVEIVPGNGDITVWLSAEGGFTVFLGILSEHLSSLSAVTVKVPRRVVPVLEHMMANLATDLRR
jgi:hypothetical protein